MIQIERYVSIVTNIAVLVGLVFVIVELRQNNEAILIDRELTLAEIYSQRAITIAADADLSRLIAKAWANDVEDLESGERVQLQNYVSAELETLISYYNMRDSDFMTQREWCSAMRIYRDFYTHEYFGSLTEGYSAFSRDILEEVNKRCPTPSVANDG